MADITKNGIVVNPSTGSGNTELKVKVQIPNKGNRVKQTAEFTVTAPGVSTPKKFTANHLPAAEFVKFDNGASQAVDKAGGVVTITGTSNSSKLTFSKGSGTIITKDISSVEYQANGSNTVNGVEISGDPGAQASYAFTLTVNAVENETVDETSSADAATPSASESESVTQQELLTGATALYSNGQEISFDPSWQYADFSAINSGTATIYLADSDRKDIVVGVNAGHGTSGGASVKTQCHPDGSPKTTGGSTAQGATYATAVSGGMTFNDGTAESTVTLQMAQILKDKLLAQGYDVLMVRNSDDVQLDNVARTVVCNNVADCHISLHWDGDGLGYDKGCFYISVPDGLKSMEPVASHWQEHDALGASLVEGLRTEGMTIYQNGSMNIDLTQTSYSTIPSVDMELGNASSDHSDSTLNSLADGLVSGVNAYFGN